MLKKNVQFLFNICWFVEEALAAMPPYKSMKFFLCNAKILYRDFRLWHIPVSSTLLKDEIFDLLTVEVIKLIWTLLQRYVMCLISSSSKHFPRDDKCVVDVDKIEGTEQNQQLVPRLGDFDHLDSALHQIMHVSKWSNFKNVNWHCFVSRSKRNKASLAGSWVGCSQFLGLPKCQFFRLAEFSSLKKHEGHSCTTS